MYRGLSKEQRVELEFEVISQRSRLNIARLFRKKTKDEEGNSDVEIILKKF